jgi:multidrug efflux pump subunit AcrA (membrane-fusion protein)
MDRPQAKDVGMFKLDPNDSYATRTPVRLGRSSVNTIEIVGGLEPGDRVILSDRRGGTTAIASG